jgi:hypothetical protein
MGDERTIRPHAQDSRILEPRTETSTASTMPPAVDEVAWNEPPTDEFLAPLSANKNHFYLGKGTVQGWRRMLQVDPSIRSWLSTAMIYIESTLHFLDHLTAEQITPELQTKIPHLSDMFEEIVHDLKSPYLDNGSLSLMSLERIQNLLFRDKRASMMRLHINMTDANKLDPSGNLGTAYKRAVLEWLQEEFGQRNISLNPEGSSFLAINVSRHAISCSVGRFDREIKYALRSPEIYERYGFDAKLIDDFAPSAKSMFMTIDTEGLHINEVLTSKDPDAILDLQAQIIGRIEESLRVLAVGTTLAERDPASIGMAAGASVYNHTDLPLIPGKAGYEVLKKNIELGLGYVPPSRYQSSSSIGTPNIDEKFQRHPRYAHDFGRLDHPERADTPGGALQILQRALLHLSSADSASEINRALEGLKEAMDLFELALDIGRMARSNPRNPAFIKWMQEIKLSDRSNLMDSYFIERVALRPEAQVHLVVMEIDSFKAFSTTYAVDETDSNFWGLFEPFFAEAKARGIDQPLITQVAGDLVALALPIVDADDRAVDINEFVTAAQQRVEKKYQDKPFHDMAKVKLRNGKGARIERQPLWQRGFAVFPSSTQPSNTDPFMNTLSVTAIATTAPTPRDADDMREWVRNINDIAKEIEALKESTAPNKGGYGFRPFAENDGLKPPPEPMGSVYPAGSAVKIDRRADRFRASIERQLEEAWGEDWTTMPLPAQNSFIGGLQSRAESSPGILTPDEVVDVMSQMSGSLAQFPPAPTLFMPLLGGIAA